MSVLYPCLLKLTIDNVIKYSSQLLISLRSQGPSTQWKKVSGTRAQPTQVRIWMILVRMSPVFLRSLLNINVIIGFFSVQVLEKALQVWGLT